MNDISRYVKLSRSFFVGSKVVEIAEELIGKYVFTNFDGRITGGRIVETEAYDGRIDRASHAFGRRTPRTEVMYGPGGHCYVYLCYGIHNMLNVVTNGRNMADAVLIRSIMPTKGLETMKERRGGDKKFKLTAGPGSVGKALGLTTKHSGLDLTGDKIWIMRCDENNVQIETDRRVGVDYAEKDALLPWRFFEKDNPWVSIKKQK